MKYSYGRLVAAASIIIAVSMPVAAYADATTSASVEAQIQSLLSQLSSLRQTLMQLHASSTPQQGDGWMNGSSTPPMNGMASSTMGMMPHQCPTLDRDLSMGATGSDVTALQQFLAQDPSLYPQGSVTGYFGPATAAAVMRFQDKNNIASSTTGIVGPMTRDFFMLRCQGGMGMPGMDATSTPWMPPASSTMPWHPDGSSTRPMMPPQGWMGTTTPGMWMSGSTTLPDNGPMRQFMQAASQVMGTSSFSNLMQQIDTQMQGQNPSGQGSGQPQAGWMGSIPPWQTNR